MLCMPIVRWPLLPRDFVPTRIPLIVTERSPPPVPPPSPPPVLASNYTTAASMTTDDDPGSTATTIIVVVVALVVALVVVAALLIALFAMRRRRQQAREKSVTAESVTVYTREDTLSSRSNEPIQTDPLAWLDPDETPAGASPEQLNALTQELMKWEYPTSKLQWEWQEPLGQGAFGLVFRLRVIDEDIILAGKPSRRINIANIM